IAMGILGMLAALAAAAQAKKGGENENKMNNAGNSTITPSNYSMPSYAGTSPTGSHSNDAANTMATSSTGDETRGPGSPVSSDPESLKKGELGIGLANIEKQYGIPGDQFVNSLKNGADPKDLLANAPKNKVPMDTLNKISEGLASNNTTG